MKTKMYLNERYKSRDDILRRRKHLNEGLKYSSSIIITNKLPKTVQIEREKKAILHQWMT